MLLQPTNIFQLWACLFPISKQNTDCFQRVVTIIKTQSMVCLWCINLQESDELNGVESVVGTPRRPLSPNSASRDPAKPAAPVDYSRYVRRYSSALECSSSYCKDLNYRSVKRLINTYLYINKINTPRNNGSMLYFLYLITLLIVINIITNFLRFLKNIKYFLELIYT